MPSAGAWAVSAKADDFFELSGGLPQALPPRIEEKSPPILAGKQRASLGGYPRGRGGHGATEAYSQEGCVGRKDMAIKERLCGSQPPPPWITFASFS